MLDAARVGDVRGGTQHGGRPDRPVLLDVGQDERDVVVAARPVGQLDELVDGLAARQAGRGDAPDLGVGHQAAQAVGTHQQPVARHDVEPAQVGFVLRGPVEHAQHQRPVRVLEGLLLGEPAVVDERLHPAVVAGHPVQPAVPHQVGARVADVDHREAVVVEHEAAHGRAEARQLRVVLDELDQPLVGVRQRAGQDGQHVDQVAGVVLGTRLDGLGLDPVLGGRREPLGPRVGDAVVEFLVGALELPGGHRRGEVAGRGAAHAVGHHQHARAGVGGVLVVAAHQPDLGVRFVAEGEGHVRPPRPGGCARSVACRPA